MRRDVSRLAGLLGGSAAGSPFAVAALVHHGTPGLIAGAVVVIVTTLIGAERPFWIIALLVRDRHQRWAWRQTGSVDQTLLLDRQSRRTLERIVEARAKLEDGPADC
ncbi:hypothetical protein AB0K60_28330 [Thermopolyspora sp. NPDC052614]|uniref:hypothetical protein n=1 Tax=Thermopolyspora sp. NPDC052614 TaxID=3155682 RepID=UPI0034210CC6